MNNAERLYAEGAGAFVVERRLRQIAGTLFCEHYDNAAKQYRTAADIARAVGQRCWKEAENLPKKL